MSVRNFSSVCDKLGVQIMVSLCVRMMYELGYVCACMFVCCKLCMDGCISDVKFSEGCRITVNGKFARKIVK
jgi:hypothetical protein